MKPQSNAKITHTKASAFDGKQFVFLNEAQRAYDILEKYQNMRFDNVEWCDIVIENSENPKYYAVYAEDSVKTNATAMYIELDKDTVLDFIIQSLPDYEA